MTEIDSAGTPANVSSATYELQTKATADSKLSIAATEDAGAPPLPAPPLGTPPLSSPPLGTPPLPAPPLGTPPLPAPPLGTPPLSSPPLGTLPLWLWQVDCCSRKTKPQTRAKRHEPTSSPDGAKTANLREGVYVSLWRLG